MQLYNKGFKVDWIFYSKIGAAILTIIILWLVFKELRQAIKDDKAGKKSGKCDLD